MTSKRFRNAKRETIQLAQLIIIVCEGENTEIDYFKRWKDEIGKNARLIVEQANGTDPTSIVQSALDYLTENASQSPVIWCVGDRDEWDVQILHDQIHRAKSKGIGYVLSVPCLEIWFVLHYEMYTRSEHHHRVQSISKSKMPPSRPKQSAKSLNQFQVESLRGNHLTAIQNAKNLDDRNETAGTAFPANPGTNMWKLVEYLDSLI